jgi:hypothetical protein
VNLDVLKIRSIEEDMREVGRKRRSEGVRNAVFFKLETCAVHCEVLSPNRENLYLKRCSSRGCGRGRQIRVRRRMR